MLDTGQCHLDSLKLGTSVGGAGTGCCTQLVTALRENNLSWERGRENNLSWEQGRVTRARVRAQSQSAKGMLVFLSATGG